MKDKRRGPFKPFNVSLCSICYLGFGKDEAEG
jgi:hypothetical protein